MFIQKAISEAVKCVIRCIAKVIWGDDCVEFKQYVGKSIIAWLWYNPNYEERFGSTNVVCYVYPRILVGNSLEKINAEEDFPENGRMEIFIRSGQNAGEIFEMFGPLVSVRINRDIPPNEKGYNRYRLNYAHPQGSGYGNTSDITIERISGKKFYQMLETEKGFGEVQKSRLLNKPETGVFTECVLVKAGSSLYGPFEYEYSGEHLLLKGSKDFQYQVGEYSFPESSENLIVIG